MMGGDRGGGGYSLVACLSHLAILTTHPFRDGALEGEGAICGK